LKLPYRSISEDDKIFSLVFLCFEIHEMEEIAADIRLECIRALNGLDSITFE